MIEIVKPINRVSNIAQPQARISLIGPSGAGKSTVAMFAQRLIPRSAVISIAQPLKDIAEHFYVILGRPSQRITGAQDGLLLQAARDDLLARDSGILKRVFTESVNSCETASLVINDDCRLAMKPTLDSMNFRFVYIEASHRGQREDQSRPADTNNLHDQVIRKDDCDLILYNQQDLHTLIDEVTDLLAIVMESKPA